MAVKLRLDAIDASVRNAPCLRRGVHAVFGKQAWRATLHGVDWRSFQSVVQCAVEMTCVCWATDIE